MDRVTAALAAAGQTGPVPPVGDRPPAVLDTLEPRSGSVLSAVLAPVFEEGGETRVVLTRRSTHLRSHRGEVSFPGGRIEPGEDATTAALRETAEEVGIDPAAVTVVGWLHPMLTYASGSLIVPVVGTTAERPVVVANPDEVERVFDVALADLVADGVFHEELWRLPADVAGPAGAGWRPLWFFAARGEMIWGATARILMELLCLALGVQPTRAATVGRSADQPPGQR
jgi:8-oxo-dGTP pyrophosphatase MutT (NUDIX family)